MSDTRRWCPHCRRQTSQQKEADAAPSERVLWAALTVGVSEVFVERFWRCLRCGNKAGAR